MCSDLNKLKKHNQSRDKEIHPLLDKVKVIQQEVLDSILDPMDIDTSSTKSAVEIPF